MAKAKQIALSTEDLGTIYNALRREQKAWRAELDSAMANEWARLNPPAGQKVVATLVAAAKARTKAVEAEYDANAQVMRKIETIMKAGMK